MKKNFYALLGISLLTSWSFAQKPERVLDKTNMREGEHVEFCVTHKKLAELKKDPVMAAMIVAAQQESENQLKSKGDNNTTKSTIYKIPVVFHILHNHGSENISKEQILDAMSILNRDYRRLNTDANNVQTPFQGMPADVEIEFELAKIAPNGACFDGITRTVTALTNDGSSGQAQVNAVIAGNDIYQGIWPHTKYLNIYVASEIGGAAGYTFNPMGDATASAQGMYYNGVFILDTYTGSIGTSNVTHSRALTHEVGHWLNLSHTWGDNNNPGNASSCGEDDHVQDTPMCIGVTSCNLSSNTCDDTNDPNNFSSWTTNVVDNVENYMDYSYCSKMFTPGQVARMRAAIISTIAGRNQIITASSHAATGIDTAPTLCMAKFATTRTVICAGESIQFTDESYNAATGWTWTFTGGSPASSTTQNPTIIYNTPGTYAVKLVATDGNSNSTSDIAGYITVLPTASGLPFYESFENMAVLSNPKWFVDNTTGNGWAVTNTVGKTGTNSAKLSNFNETTTGQTDELIAAPVDLSSINTATGVTLTFKCAYRKKASTNSDILRVLLSKDCGETWEIRKTVTATSMSGTNTATTTWTPTSADWLTVHVTNITSAFWTDNFRYKFQFISGGGNNVYIDDINVYAGSPSEEPVTAGLQDLGSLADISLFPNPADNEVQIAFSSKTASNEIKLYVTDLTGKRLQQHVVQANEGNNLVYITTSDLSAGTYLIQMVSESGQRTLTFVKK
ncbi:M43 family zinc metalloprotease [Fluviicola sp.]|jgi:PKD repeat protein|uniref:M43 family zinc metalloprotease n=1 Tax=Fluviicola sp. TaxID=1917219 RepID=UPI00281C7EAC|nr:M43 family zinc metalloprotease [Fluviicola sp.]MDR0802688.1 PKD domain-containing protein [Fluviicola sp.]